MLEDFFTSEQITSLIKAPLDVAALAAEADFELEQIELDELSQQLSTYEGNKNVKKVFEKFQVCHPQREKVANYLIFV